MYRLHRKSESIMVIWGPTKYHITQNYAITELPLLFAYGKNRFSPYANNKGADQPAHPRSLISTFVVPYLDNIKSIFAKSTISRL